MVPKNPSLLSEIQYYILNIDEKLYEEVRKTRVLEVTSRFKYRPKDQFLFIMKVKDIQTIIAEYEVESMEQLDVGKKIKLEPIYNAPRFGGLKLDDMIKMQVSPYIDYKRKHSRIKEKDFTFLAQKLVS